MCTRWHRFCRKVGWLLIVEIALLRDTVNLFTSNVALICFACFAVFSLRSFNFRLLYLLIYFTLPYETVDGEIKMDKYRPRYCSLPEECTVEYVHYTQQA